METKHTPGPWELTAYNSSGDKKSLPYDTIISKQDGVMEYVAHINIRGGRKEEADGNAALISAAPDLLDALTRLVEETEEFPQGARLSKARELAGKAIQKAQPPSASSFLPPLMLREGDELFRRRLAMQHRMLSDEVLRDAAPELLEALKDQQELIQQILGFMKMNGLEWNEKPSQVDVYIKADRLIEKFNSKEIV